MKIWNLKYVLGNTGKVVADAQNPHSRKSALAAAEVITKNGWRAWIEHHEKSDQRLYENSHEKAHRDSKMD